MNNLYYEKLADSTNYFNFHYANNNTIAAHFHKNIEILFVNKGKVDVIINGKKEVLSKYDIAFSNNFDVHYYYGSLDSEVYVLVFSSDFLYKNSKLGNKIFKNFLFSCDGSKEIYCFLSLFKQQMQKNNIEMQIGFINYLFGLLIKHYSNDLLDKNEDMNKYAKMLQYIYENSAEDLNLTDVANKFGYTKNYFSLLFKKVTGFHFRDYINKVRIEKINELITIGTSTSICDLALSNGFNSLNTFYRAKNKFDAKS